LSAPDTGDLTIMPDYECFSFWVANGGLRDNVDPATLGIPPELAAEIDAWEQAYEATYVSDDPASCGFPDEKSERAFTVAGLKIAERVADALGPGWSVKYYDCLTRKVILLAAGVPPA
jgi:hypothetical protein